MINDYVERTLVWSERQRLDTYWRRTLVVIYLMGLLLLCYFKLTINAFLKPIIRALLIVCRMRERKGVP